MATTTSIGKPCMKSNFFEAAGFYNGSNIVTPTNSPANHPGPQNRGGGGRGGGAGAAAAPPQECQSMEHVGCRKRIGDYKMSLHRFNFLSDSCCFLFAIVQIYVNRTRPVRVNAHGELN